MKRLNTAKGENGQVLVIVALFMIALLAVMALVLDGGNIYLQRRRMQNAADAGALAGTRVLALNGTTAEAQAKAQEYAAQRNGADSVQVTINAQGITVVACENVQMTFAQVIGLQSVMVCARAGAAFAPISAAGGVAPISILDFPYQFDVPYVIWDDDVDRDPLAGYISGSYRGWLNLPCVLPMSCGDAGAENLKDWMRNGYEGMTYVDTWIKGDGGVKAAVIQQASVGQVLQIIVYESINADSYYHVVKFAAFKVTQVYATGNPKGIRGMFQHYFTPGPHGDDDDPDGGWRTVDLTQ